jgi:hypothetical protein
VPLQQRDVENLARDFVPQECGKNRATRMRALKFKELPQCRRNWSARRGWICKVLRHATGRVRGNERCESGGGTFLPLDLSGSP